MLVGLAEPAQVWRDDFSGVLEQWHDLAVVTAVPGPAVQHDHGWATAGPVVGETESIDRKFLAHAASIPSPETRFQRPEWGTTRPDS